MPCANGFSVGRRLCILLAEEDAAVREQIAALLGAYYTVEAVADGLAALECLGHGFLPDLILCGLALPRLDGAGVLRAIRHHPTLARLPVVLITAGGPDTDRLLRMEEEIDDFIAKPVDERELNLRVCQVLARTRASREARDREDHLRTDLARQSLPASTPMLLGAFPDAAEALHVCEQRFLAVTGQAGAGVARTDLEGGILEVNARFCEITGYHEDELLGRPLLSLTHADDMSRETPLFVSLMADGAAYDLEKRCARRNGAPLWVRASVTPLRGTDGRMRAALAVMLDVNGQRETRQRLRDNEARVCAFFAQTVFGLSEITLEGRFLHVNDQLCHMLGRTRTEMLAADVSLVTHPEDQPNTWRAFQRLVETGVPVSIDKRYLHADGTVIWANSSLTRLCDGWGRARGVLAVTLDVTDRVLAEGVLREGRQG